LPIRFNACIPSVTSRPASVFVKFDMSVSITPGATAFTRMPWPCFLRGKNCLQRNETRLRGNLDSYFVQLTGAPCLFDRLELHFQIIGAVNPNGTDRIADTQGPSRIDRMRLFRRLLHGSFLRTEKSPNRHPLQDRMEFVGVGC
jgi:hypothetical protein